LSCRGAWHDPGRAILVPAGQDRLADLRPVRRRNGLDLVINNAYGLTAWAAAPSWFAISGASEVFLEHEEIGFFGLNRLLGGLTWRY
jgi:hypothetical protein